MRRGWGEGWGGVGWGGVGGGGCISTLVRKCEEIQERKRVLCDVMIMVM